MARSLMDLYGGGMGGPATNYQLGGAIAQSRRGREYQGEKRKLYEQAETAARRQKRAGGLGSLLGKVGAVAGSFIPIPGVGTALGSAIGSGLGAAAGRALGESTYRRPGVSEGKYLQTSRGDVKDYIDIFKESQGERALTEGLSAAYKSYAPSFTDLARDFGIGGKKFAAEVTKKGIEDNPWLKDREAFLTTTPTEESLMDFLPMEAPIRPKVGLGLGELLPDEINLDVDVPAMVGPEMEYNPLSFSYDDMIRYGNYQGPMMSRKGGGLINYEKPLMQAGGYLSSSLASPMIGGMEEYGMEPPSPQPPPPPPPPSPPAPPAGSGLGLPPTIGGTGMGTGTGAGTFTGTGTGAGTVTGTGTGTGAGIGTLTGTGAGTGGSAGPPPPVAPTVYGPVMPSTPATSGAAGQIGGTYGTAIDPMAALQQMGMGDIASDPKLQEYLKDLPQFGMGYQQQLGDIKTAGRQSLREAYAAQRAGGAGRGFAGAGIGGQQFGQQVGDIRTGVSRQRRGIVEGFQKDLLSSIRDIEQKGEFEFGVEAPPWEQMGITEAEYNTLMGIEQAQDVPETGDLGLLDPTQGGMGGTTGWGGTSAGTTGFGGTTGWGGETPGTTGAGTTGWGQGQWQQQQQQNPWQQQQQQQTTGQQEQQYDEFGFPIG